MINGKICQCNVALVGDGNLKLMRNKCIYDDGSKALNLNTIEFGNILTGCRLSPARGSYYCKAHLNYELKFNVNNTKVSWNPNLIVKSNLGNKIILITIMLNIKLFLGSNEKVLFIHDSYIDYNDTELFLVETNKEPLKWCVKQQIKKEILDSFVEKKKKEKAAQYNKLYELSCNTDKSNITSCDIKCKSRGLILLVSNCGITVSFREIFGAESLTQVAMLMMDTLDIFQGNESIYYIFVIIKLKYDILLDKQPDYIIYDDACHLRRFIQNDKNYNKTTPRLENFRKKHFVVDKLHIQGHTEVWCHKNCAPHLFPDLDDINTIVCEQINFLIGRYKYILKHMSAERYNFYIYIVLNELNKLKIYGRNELFGFHMQKCSKLIREQLKKLNENQ